MPIGKVRWYDVDKGFGFLVTDDGEDVFVHASALPEGITSLKQGARVEFGIVDGKRGKQALTLTVHEPAASVVKSTRKPAEDMAPIVEDLIKLLDAASNQLRRGRYPADDHAQKVAQLLRAVAQEFDV
ncbi:MAG: cold shock domain-containing protein [Candidatus Nanopelagicales bacterium]